MNIIFESQNGFEKNSTKSLFVEVKSSCHLEVKNEIKSVCMTSISISKGIVSFERSHTNLPMALI